MKKVIVLSILGLFAWSALAADKLTLQLKWVTQAQFAGYYVAKDKGYYSAEGLDVTIKPGGPDIACLLYTSPSPRDRTRSRMPSSA